MAEVAAVLILVGLIAYTVLGGADFGAGLWELSARGERNEALRDHTHRSMAPVWEANHVWVIFVITLYWTCFPDAFAQTMTTLVVPLFVAAVGVVLRGAAYALRAGVSSAREEGVISLLFALSSLLTPFALGTAIGAIASGRVPAEGSGDELTSWLNETALLIGVLAVATSAYLAAVYLAADARRMGDEPIAEAFRRRALAAGVVAGGLALAGPFVIESDAPDLYDGLTSGGGLAAVVASALAGTIALALVAARRYEPARVAAAAAVTAVIAGWALAQEPDLLPGLTIEQAAASDATIAAVLIGAVAGALILVPSLAYLFRLVLTGRFDPAAPLPAGAAPGASGARGTAAPAAVGAVAARDGRTERSSLRPVLATGALTALGAAVTFVSDGHLRGVGVTLMLAGAIACFLALATLDEGDAPRSADPTRSD